MQIRDQINWWQRGLQEETRLSDKICPELCTTLTWEHCDTWEVTHHPLALCSQMCQMWCKGLLPQQLQPSFMIRKLLCWDSRSLFTWSCWHITAKMNKPLDNNNKQIRWFKQEYYGNHRWCSLVIKTQKWRYVIRKAKSGKKNLWCIKLVKGSNSRKNSHCEMVT